jgi:hypothetical protein
MQFETYADCDDPRPKFSEINRTYLSSWETRTWQEGGWPNNSHGGCSRNFEDYYQFLIEQLKKNQIQTLLIYKVEGQGETITDETPWVRFTYNHMHFTYPDTFRSYAVVGQIQNIESNIPDIMNQVISDVFSSSATCGIDPKTGDEIANIDPYPTYYYMFFETGWDNYDPPALRVYAPHERGLRYDESSKKLLAPDREQGSPAEPRTSITCPADINNDGVVNVDDLLQLIMSWGDKGGPADIDGDGIVGISDLLALIKSWGSCPVANYPYKLTALDGAANDKFGDSVSIEGDKVIVGASQQYYDSPTPGIGSAYVFRFDGSEWNQESKLLASDGAVYDYFGKSVSISGNTALIGAFRNDETAHLAGAAYVFRFTDGKWIEEQKLLASDGAMLDWFGYSVAIDGDTCVIGATYAASAYVFRFNGTQWIEEAKLNASGVSSSERFGEQVSISGDRVLIGAMWDDENGYKAGSAYVFRFVGGEWIEESKLLPSEVEEMDWFGQGVSISGERAIVGAYGDSDNAADAGTAYVFRFDDGEWTQDYNKLLASDGKAGDSLGESVSILGDYAVISAVGSDDYGTNSGAVYIFKRDNDNGGFMWYDLLKITAFDATSWDYFGQSVDMDGDLVVIGATGDDDHGQGSGSVYIYHTAGETSAMSSDGDFDSWKSAWIIAQSKDSLAANIILQEMHKRFTFDDINLGIPTTTSTSVPTPSPESSLQSPTPSPSPSPSPTPSPAPPPPPSPTPETEGYD